MSTKERFGMDKELDDKVPFPLLLVALSFEFSGPRVKRISNFQILSPNYYMFNIF